MNIKEINYKELKNPINLIKFLWKTKYIHFFITGTSGVLINLVFAFIFVEYVFTNPSYNFFITIQNTTIGIIIGTSINLIYNFILHTNMTFKTKKNHTKRFLIFIIYSLFVSYFINLPLTILFRNFLEKTLPEFISSYSYLISSAFVILFVSCFTFIFFKLYLFKEKK